VQGMELKMQEALFDVAGCLVAPITCLSDCQRETWRRTGHSTPSRSQSWMPVPGYSSVDRLAYELIRSGSFSKLPHLIQHLRSNRKAGAVD
jgi:hypothetical protein